MSAAQMDLFEARSPVREEADAGVLADYLYLEGCWRTRREIAAALDWPDWRIRHAAEAAEGDVVFGQRGMKHIRHATPEEVRACISTLQSQVEANTLRILNTQKKYHSFGGGL